MNPFLNLHDPFAGIPGDPMGAVLALQTIDGDDKGVDAAEPGTQTCVNTGACSNTGTCDHTTSCKGTNLCAETRSCSGTNACPNTGSCS